MANAGSHKPSNDNTIHIWTLYIISIICGAALMALEIEGGRLLSPFFGNSVYVWGSVISIFLIALSVGYYFGGSLSDKKPKLEMLGLLIGASGLLIYVIPYLLPIVVSFSFKAGFLNYGALFVGLALFFLPSVGLGMVSPYVVKLGVLESAKVGELVGRFYAISTFGSILGTLGTTFVLTPLFGVRKVIYAMGIILLLLAICIFILKKKIYKALACFLLILSLISISLFYTPSLGHAAEFGTLLYERETLYNNLAVVDGWNGLRYLLFNETEQSAMSQSQPEAHIFPYTELMTSVAEHFKPNAGKELLIGLGGGTIPKYTYEYRPKVDMDTVEIDPEVVKVAKQYFYLKDNARIHNMVGDGRMFLKDKQKDYDVIFVDAYNRTGIPYHLTTMEFFQELAKAMRPDGIVIFNVVSGIEGENGLFLKSLLKTSNQVFKHYKLFFAERTNSLEDITNLILVVSNNELTDNQVGKYAAFQGNIDLSDAIILTDDYAPVDTLAAPIMMR